MHSIASGQTKYNMFRSLDPLWNFAPCFSLTWSFYHHMCSSILFVSSARVVFFWWFSEISLFLSQIYALFLWWAGRVCVCVYFCEWKKWGGLSEVLTTLLCVERGREMDTMGIERMGRESRNARCWGRCVSDGRRADQLRNWTLATLYDQSRTTAACNWLR